MILPWWGRVAMKSRCSPINTLSNYQQVKANAVSYRAAKWSSTALLSHRTLKINWLDIPIRGRQPFMIKNVPLSSQSPLEPPPMLKTQTTKCPTPKSSWPPQDQLRIKAALRRKKALLVRLARRTSSRVPPWPSNRLLLGAVISHVRVELAGQISSCNENNLSNERIFFKFELSVKSLQLKFLAQIDL